MQRDPDTEPPPRPEPGGRCTSGSSARRGGGTRHTSSTTTGEGQASARAVARRRTVHALVGLVVRLVHVGAARVELARAVGDPDLPEGLAREATGPARELRS